VPRSALSRLAATLVVAIPTTLWGVDPHLDPALVPGGCAACHEGHGTPRSPMLRGPVEEVCLACHGSRAGADAQVAAGRLAPGARPPLLDTVLALPFVHPHDRIALSRHDSGSVVCTSCHSPHRRSVALGGPAPEGEPKLSTRDPRRLEYELCESCHGRSGPGAPSPSDLASLFDPSSRSYHPVHAPAVDGSPSVSPGLAGRQINCTDCHGNSRQDLPRGPHGSDFHPLLVDNLSTLDGAAGRADGSALCFRCHDATAVVAPTSPFPLHGLHVDQEAAACSTCHSAHGSLGNRALVRFGEERHAAVVQPSISTGELGFESEAPGAGSCSLTCHGVDHGPKSYGGDAAALAARRPASSLRPAPPASPRGPRSNAGDEPLKRPRRPAEPRPPA